MTLKQLIIIMLLATIICWLCFAGVLIQIDPTDSIILGPILFYLTLFSSLLGTFFLVSFAWRKLFSKYALDYKMVAISFRQSFFLALIAIGILLLQAQNLLSWWSVSLVIIAIVLVEGFFLSVKRQV